MQFLHHAVKGKAVIEVGCGLGVPACAAALAGAAKVRDHRDMLCTGKSFEYVAFAKSGISDLCCKGINNLYGV